MKLRKFKRLDRQKSPWGFGYRQSDGARRSRFFSTKISRDIEAKRLEDKFRMDGSQLADVDIDEWQIWRQAKKTLGEVPVMTAVAYYLKSHQGVREIPFTDARERYLLDQSRRGCCADHIRHLTRAMDVLNSVALNPFQLRTEALQVWFDNAVFGAETKQNYRKYFRAFYNYCIAQGIAAENPAKQVKLPRYVRPEPKIASLEHIRILFSRSWAKDPGATARMALEAFAGLRASAAGRIQYGDINFKQRGITIRAQANTKNERRHYIDGLPETVWSYLDAVSEEDFTMSGSQYMHRKSRCVSWSGIRLPKNALRHSFVTYLCAWKKTADLAAYIIGHRRASSLLFDHYRGIASKEEGKAYFEAHLGRVCA